MSLSHGLRGLLAIFCNLVTRQLATRKNHFRILHFQICFMFFSLLQSNLTFSLVTFYKNETRRLHISTMNNDYIFFFGLFVFVFFCFFFETELCVTALDPGYPRTQELDHAALNSQRSTATATTTRLPFIFK